MLTEKTIDLSLTPRKLDELILKAELRDEKQIIEKLNLLFEVNAESKPTEELRYSEQALAALALNRPDIIEGVSYIDDAEDCILLLNNAEREVLRIWTSIREQLSVKEHLKKAAKPQ